MSKPRTQNLNLNSEDDEARWQAVVERHAAADGRFLYAVVSTGIYCRPTCPSKRPNRVNVRFFDSAAAAVAEGFRACKRCRPDTVSRQQQIVAEVKRLIADSDTEPTLEALGAALSLSPYHLQRVFKRATGLSPKQYGLALREQQLKAGLRRAGSVTSAMYDAGYGSSRALYADGHRRLGMQPATYRKGGAGAEIEYAVFDSELGPFLVAQTEAGLVRLEFGKRSAMTAALVAEFPAATLVEIPEALEPSRRAILSYLQGDSDALGLPLDLAPTEFQSLVWQELERIPYGETCSYGEIAERLGRPGAARAVARACATNPIALVIPCHRVVSASGGLGGYRWGVERKRMLLEGESTPQA